MHELTPASSSTNRCAQKWMGPAPMIDWISGYWRILDPFGHVIDPAMLDGLRGHQVITCEQESGQVISEGYSRRKIGPFEGCSSYSTLTKVVSGELYISGNPLSFTQGHNLFSRLEPWDAVRKWENDLLRRAKIPDHKMELVRLTRIDLTQEVDCESREASLATLNALKAGWTAPKCRKTIEDNSVYLGKASSRWTLKAYRKSTLAHNVLPGNESTDISAFLRIELCLRAPGMKAAKLDPTDSRNWNLCEVFRQFLGRCNLSRGNQVHSLERMPEGLSNVMRGHWARWRGGARLREELAQSTYHRVKKAFLEIGIDIDSPPTKVACDRVRALSWEEILNPSRWHGTDFTGADIQTARAARADWRNARER